MGLRELMGQWWTGHTKAIIIAITHNLSKTTPRLCLLLGPLAVTAFTAAQVGQTATAAAVAAAAHDGRCDAGIAVNTAQGAVLCPGTGADIDSPYSPRPRGSRVAVPLKGSHGDAQVVHSHAPAEVDDGLLLEVAVHSEELLDGLALLFYF